MGVLRLAVCISGVYAAFLLWAIAQERLSKPFPTAVRHPHPAHTKAGDPAGLGDKFPSPLFFNWCQALAGATCSGLYLIFHAWRDGSLKARGVAGVLGLTKLLGREGPVGEGHKAEAEKPASAQTNGHVNGHANGSAQPSTAATKVENGSNGNLIDAKSSVAAPSPPTPWHRTLPVLLLQVSLCQTTAGPIGFLALRHISYPMMVLAKSCKLIPVLLLNVLLYRRRFGVHKYLVVALVSLGIALFMLLGGKSKKGGDNSVYGLVLLLINLFIDGLTNSTQDQLFSLYPGFSGQQMMFIMATITLSVLTPLMVLPLPSNPWSIIAKITGSDTPTLSHLHAITLSAPILLQSVRFVVTHPSGLSPLLAYAGLGGLGQIFIFETIAHFGSLTLVMVTVTRKLFTMLLSVFVFGHKLTQGQWAGVAIVFAGIGVEAGFKRREVSKRAKRD